jgi:hypothetical protein
MYTPYSPTPLSKSSNKGSLRGSPSRPSSRATSPVHTLNAARDEAVLFSTTTPSKTVVPEEVSPGRSDETAATFAKSNGPPMDGDLLHGKRVNWSDAAGIS